jgi:hypothetical protein
MSIYTRAKNTARKLRMLGSSLLRCSGGCVSRFGLNC